MVVCLSLGSLGSKSLVFLVSYHLKMVFVNTQAIVAPMVDLFLSWDETEVVGIHYEMNSNGLTV